jgi:two-component system invasion response regulator UvrY
MRRNATYRLRKVEARLDGSPAHLLKGVNRHVKFMIRILIADDHAIFRRGLMETLLGTFPKAVFGEAQTAQETLDLIQRQEWALIILDISMPGKGGLEILHEAKLLRPRLPILILSMYPEEQFARRALKAGAAGYLTKESVPEELILAVRKVIGGGRYVSVALAERLASDLKRGSSVALHELLSDREFQVLRMIASGMSLKDIADQLTLSVKTVSTYRARILLKTRLRSTADLVRYAVQNALVD